MLGNDNSLLWLLLLLLIIIINYQLLIIIGSRLIESVWCRYWMILSAFSTKFIVVLKRNYNSPDWLLLCLMENCFFLHLVKALVWTFVLMV